MGRFTCGDSPDPWYREPAAATHGHAKQVLGRRRLAVRAPATEAPATIGDRSAQHLSRVQDACGIESGLNRAHHIDGIPMLGSKVVSLARADTMLAGTGPAP